MIYILNRTHFLFCFCFCIVLSCLSHLVNEPFSCWQVFTGHASFVTAVRFSPSNVGAQWKMFDPFGDMGPIWVWHGFWYFDVVSCTKTIKHMLATCDMVLWSWVFSKNRQYLFFYFLWLDLISVFMYSLWICNMYVILSGTVFANQIQSVGNLPGFVFCILLESQLQRIPKNMALELRHGKRWRISNTALDRCLSNAYCSLIRMRGQYDLSKNNTLGIEM